MMGEEESESYSSCANSCIRAVFTDVVRRNLNASSCILTVFTDMMGGEESESYSPFANSCILPIYRSDW